MNKAISLALLVGGILLLILGINAYDSSASDIARFFTGSPTDKAVWLMLGGVIGIGVGSVGLSRVSKKV
jgi:hypothetical protein